MKYGHYISYPKTTGKLLALYELLSPGPLADLLPKDLFERVQGVVSQAEAQAALICGTNGESFDPKDGTRQFQILSNELERMVELVRYSLEHKEHIGTLYDQALKSQLIKIRPFYRSIDDLLDDPPEPAATRR